jgi:uncharacterized membrane protein YfcA
LDFLTGSVEDAHVTWWLEIAIVGLGIGTVFGLFGAGGSAFATPVLALLGLPGVVAIATPLPAVLPASAVGARLSVRSGRFDRRLAARSAAGGVPGAVLGALLSRFVSGTALLVLSGVMLAAIGARVLAPDRAGARARGHARRERTVMVVGLAFLVGLLTGLLANSGGFLLVPLFIVVFGLTASEAASTSMVVVGALTIPTFVVHAALGHIDWVVATAFAVGMLPGSVIGTRLAERLPAAGLRRSFGAMLVVFAIWFLGRELA